MKKSLILMMLSNIMLSNCSKNNSVSTVTPSEFPNKIGVKFTYAVIDSVNNSKFNVNVAIISKSTLSNGTPVAVWTFTYPAFIDTNYVSSNQDSVIFYDKSKTAITNVYHFPLTIGAKWRQSFLTDSSTVVNNQSLTTSAGTFPNTYVIQEYGHSHNYKISKTQWYAPNIGLVKIYIRQFTFATPTIQTWELTSYNLN